jgi:hypothetical protein
MKKVNIELWVRDEDEINDDTVGVALGRAIMDNEIRYTSASKDHCGDYIDRHREVLEYCYDHLDKMWAAKVASILLDCDFRDAKTYAKLVLERED